MTAVYSRGTYLDMSYPFGVIRSGAAICSDGKVRKLSRVASSASSFDEIPAAVRVKVKGRSYTIAGYVTVRTEEGWTNPSGADPACLKFVARAGRKNSHMLPEGTWKRTKESARIIRILSVDALRDSEGGWQWNMWHEVGRCEVSLCDAGPAAILAYMREHGYLSKYSAGNSAIEDDGYNVVIMARGTHEPLYALEYGAEPLTQAS